MIFLNQVFWILFCKNNIIKCSFYQLINFKIIEGISRKVKGLDLYFLLKLNITVSLFSYAFFVIISINYNNFSVKSQLLENGFVMLFC